MRHRAPRRTLEGMHRIALALFLSLSSSAACTDDPPAWLATCEAKPPLVRADECKEACGAGELCPGADQPTCELECNACAPSVAWCPLEVAP